MRIKNWTTFQHYKERCPPWIKLHRTLLDDRQFHSLKGDHARFLIMAWMLASEDKLQQGTLPTVADIAFRLRMKEKDVEESLSAVSEWLVWDARAVLAPCKQEPLLETETERETKTERDVELDSAERCPSASTPAPVPVHQRVRFESTSGRITGIEDTDFDRLAEACPAVDVRLEASKAGSWLLANPTKRKKNVWRFLTSWCARCQEKGGTKSVNGGTGFKSFNSWMHEKVEL